MPMENQTGLIERGVRYVGVQTNLRESAVLLSGGWRHIADRVDVPQSLALADDLLRRRNRIFGWWVGVVSQAARLS